MAKLKIPKFIRIILLTILIVISPVLYLVLGLLSWMTISIAGTWLFTPNPPKPEITYGEFPFEVVYEIDGERVRVNDIYVCEYVGIGANEGTGKYREWKGYIKSTGEENLILHKDGNLTFYLALGYPKYYMSDPYMPSEEYIPYIYYVEYPDKFGGSFSGADDALLLQYNLKLLSWDLSDPIQNSFE